MKQARGQGIITPELHKPIILQKTKRIVDNHQLSVFIMVPGTGVEPVQPEGRGILSPLRLPIPPPGREVLS